MLGYKAPLGVLVAIATGLTASSAMAQLRFGGTKATPTELRSVPAEQTAAANKDPKWKAPRTAWGEPDLQGTWSSDDMRSVPMVRPDQFGTRLEMTPEEFQERAERDQGGRNRAVNDETLLRNEWGIRTFGYTSIIIDPPNGKIPALTPAGTARAAKIPRGTYGPGPYNTVDQFGLYDRCVTRGPLGSILPVIYGNGLTITQSPGKVVVSYEMIHDTRTIYLDGRPAPDPNIQQYMGISRGHWEGNTLVVEATNFTDETSLGINGNGTPNSKQLKITERWTRIDPDMINYVAKVEDPLMLTAPYTIRLTITHQPNYHVYEYSCHEGNTAIRLPLSGERAFDRKVAEAKAKGLPIPKREEYAGFKAYAPPSEGTEVFNVNEGE